MRNLRRGWIGGLTGFIRALVWFVLFLIGASSPAWALDWQIEYVIDGKVFSDMTSRSLCIDADGIPHVVYGGDYLYLSLIHI